MEYCVGDATEIDWDKIYATKYPTKDYIYNTERTLKIQQ